MYTCEIIKENKQYRFECLDYRGFSVFRSVDFDSRDKALSQLTDYINLDLEYVYEVCEGEDCHYFKITHKGLLLIESRSFDDKESTYDFVEKLQGGCAISHIIDKSFADSDVYYYLTCTTLLQFKTPIRIEIEREDSQYVASIPLLNLYSYSEDLKGVIDEIKLDIDDLYNDLFVEKYKLSSKAEGIKKEFESKLKLNGLSKFH